jgi:hypothetical protein
MSKTEMLRQSAQAKNATRLEALAHQVQAVREVRHQSVEDLAAMLEPLAQALAALSDETRSTLVEIESRSRATGENFQIQLEAASRALKDAIAQTQIQAHLQAQIQEQTQAHLTRSAADAMNRAGALLHRRHCIWTMAAAVATGTVSAVLVSAFWLLLSPPTLQGSLDPKALALWLKPVLIDALKTPRGK